MKGLDAKLEEEKEEAIKKADKETYFLVTGKEKEKAAALRKKILGA